MLKINLSDRLRKILFVLSLITLITSLVLIAARLIAYSKDNSQYEDLRNATERERPFEDALPTVTPPPAASDPEKPASIPYTVQSGDASLLNSDGILKDYEKLYSQNNDLAGWIYIPGYKKPIDYPVMRAKDNDYYLRRDFYRNKSNAGSIFMEASNSPKEVDRNYVLYGHAMLDLSMFGNLTDYAGNADEYTQITSIYLDLLNTRLEYKVFSCYFEESNYNYRQTHFSNDEEYMDFLTRIQSKSYYDYGVVLSPQDKIITLSTCNKKYGKDGRAVIHARLVRQINYDGASGGEYLGGESGDKKIVSANKYLEVLSLKYNTADIVPVTKAAISMEGTATPAPSAPSPSPNTTEAPAATAVTDTANTTASPSTVPVPLQETNAPTPEPNAPTPESVTPSPQPETKSPVPDSSGKPADKTTFKDVDVALDPAFHTTLREYTAYVPEGLGKISLTAVATDPEAKMVVLVNEVKVTPPTITLKAGENLIKVSVTSRDGLYTRVYSIKVMRIAGK